MRLRLIVPIETHVQLRAAVYNRGPPDPTHVLLVPAHCFRRLSQSTIPPALQEDNTTLAIAQMTHQPALAIVFPIPQARCGEAQPQDYGLHTEYLD